LKCQVDVRSGATIVAQRVDPQLVALEMTLVIRPIGLSNAPSTAR
jgi:hypothetical protein